MFALTNDDPLAARLAAELEGLGLVVSRAQIDPSVPIEELVRQAIAGGARGVVVADGRRTEFWVAEEGTDRVAMRQELEIESSPSMESVLSLRTVEFLRVSLGLTSRSDGTPPVVPPSPTVPLPRPEPERRLGLGLSAGVIGSTGRLPPFATAGASLRVRIAGPAGLELRGLVPLGTQHLEAPGGQLDTSVWLGGGGLLLAPRMTGRLGFDAGAGALAALVWASGTNTDKSSRSGHTVGLALYGRVAGRVRLTPSWSVRLDVLAGSTALRPPTLEIGMGGGVITKWGVGFLSGLAGAEATF